MPPVYVMVKPVSGACNLRCRYCFYADEMANREIPSYGKMSDETLEAVVKRVFDEAEGEAGFAFQGGEPTLAGLGFYQRFVSLAEKYNVRRLPVSYALQTNGTLIDNEWAAFFTRYGFLIGLSLDGDRELHDGCRLDEHRNGTFRAVMRAAETMQSHGTAFNILCTVTNFTARHGNRVYRFFKENGFRYLQFTPCIDSFDCETPSVYSLTPARYASFLCTVFDRYYEDWCRNDYTSIRWFDNLVHLIKNGQAEMCGMNGQCAASLIIEADGGVYPCDFYMLDDYRLGSVLTDSFSAMRQSDTAKRFIASSQVTDADCGACRYFGVCRGGCRRFREPFINGLPQKNRFCESFRAFFDYALPRLLIMAQTL